MLWHSVDRLLGSAAVEGIRAHKLGPLAARRLRRLGRPVDPVLAHDERAAAVSMLIAIPLLKRIRASCDGPLLLIKGPEVASLYPDGARSFSDVDLLSPDARQVHKALRASGFAEVDDPELFRDHHHLQPLKWPTLGLKVEIHLRPLWPYGVEAPALEEIVASAVPSRLEVDGIAAPCPSHHALIMAAHAWEHEPLHTLRDLVDVAAVAGACEDAELEQTARAWRIPKIWRTTRGAIGTLLGGEPATVPIRVWARHLRAVRERTVLDNHLLRWMHAFWERPLPAALGATGKALRQEVLPMPGEVWGDKLARAGHAIRHPGQPLSAHRSAWPEAARRGQRRRSKPRSE